jgi:hypothetical protein
MKGKIFRLAGVEPTMMSVMPSFTSVLKAVRPAMPAPRISTWQLTTARQQIISFRNNKKIEILNFKVTGKSLKSAAGLPALLAGLKVWSGLAENDLILDGLLLLLHFLLELGFFPAQLLRGLEAARLCYSLNHRQILAGRCLC